MTESQLYLQGAAFGIETKAGTMISVTARSRRDVEQGHRGGFVAYRNVGDKTYHTQLLPAEAWNVIAEKYDLPTFTKDTPAKDVRVNITSNGESKSIAFAGQVLGGGRGVKWATINVDNLPEFDIAAEQKRNAEAATAKTENAA